MAFIRASQGGGGSGTIRAGSFTAYAIADYTFDCGINNPDLVFVSSDRNTNDWCGILVNGLTFFTYSTSGLFSFASSTSYMNRFVNNMSSYGSNVTVGAGIIASGVTYKWIAVKMP